jgi:hypothetical protein
MQVPELQIQEVPYHIVNEEILCEWQMTMIDNRRLSVDDPFCQHFYFGAQYARHAVEFVQVYSNYVLVVLICIAAVVAQQRHWNLQRQQQYKPYNIIIVFGTQAYLEVFCVWALNIVKHAIWKDPAWRHSMLEKCRSRPLPRMPQ